MITDKKLSIEYYKILLRQRSILKSQLAIVETEIQVYENGRTGKERDNRKKSGRQNCRRSSEIHKSSGNIRDNYSHGSSLLKNNNKDGDELNARKHII